MTNPDLELARRYVAERIKKNMEERLRAVVPPPPNSGKTYGFQSALSDLDEKGTLLQPNRDLREESTRTADSLDLTNIDLKSFPEHCALADPDSDFYDERAVDEYRRGAWPREIASRYEVPDDDEYFNQQTEDWPLNDLIVGDAAHAFLTQTTSDRHVAFDDVRIGQKFLQEFQIGDERLGRAVREYLEYYEDDIEQYAFGTDASPPKSLTSVLTANDVMKRAINDVAVKYPSREIIPETNDVRSTTSEVLRVLTASTAHLKWKETDRFTGAGVHTVGVFLEDLDRVLLFKLPLALQEAKSVQILNATPEIPIIRQFFNEINDFGDQWSIQQPIPEEMLLNYYDEILNLRITQITEHLRPISGNNWTGSLARLDAIIESYQKLYDAPPLIISSKKFLDEHGPTYLKNKYGYTPVDEPGPSYVHFAKAVGTNEFSDVTHAVVFGCPHYGDDYVRKMAALAGDFDAEPVRYEDEDGNPCKKSDPDATRVPTYWSTETSQEIYWRMAAGSVLQAMLRAGRSTDEPTHIWVETSAIPEFVPRRISPLVMLTETQKAICELIKDGKPHTVEEIADEIDVSRKSVYNSLPDLLRADVVEESGEAKWGAQTYEILSEAPELLPKALNLSYKGPYIREVQRNRNHEPGLSDLPGWMTGHGTESIDEAVFGRSDVSKVGDSIAVQETFDVELGTGMSIPLAENDLPDTEQATLEVE